MSRYASPVGDYFFEPRTTPKFYYNCTEDDKYLHHVYTGPMWCIQIWLPSCVFYSVLFSHSFSSLFFVLIYASCPVEKTLIAGLDKYGVRVRK